MSGASVMEKLAAVPAILASCLLVLVLALTTMCILVSTRTAVNVTTGPVTIEIQFKVGVPDVPNTLRGAQ